MHPEFRRTTLVKAGRKRAQSPTPTCRVTAGRLGHLSEPQPLSRGDTENSLSSRGEIQINREKNSAQSLARAKQAIDSVASTALFQLLVNRNLLYLNSRPLKTDGIQLRL